jgi:hypothetical protein
MDLTRRMTPAEKLQRAIELSAAVRQAGEAGIRQANPNASEEEIFALIARRQLGDELFMRVYGPSERHA